MSRVRNVRHVGLVVKDMKKMVRFYQAFLGFKVMEDFVESGPYIEKLLGFPQAKVWMIKMVAKEGGMIELLRFGSKNRLLPRALNRPGFTHLALTVRNLKECLRRGRGLKGISAPLVAPNGKALVAFCRDPEGNFLELVEVRSQ